jgi:phosphoribosylamine-glycine ligase
MPTASIGITEDIPAKVAAGSAYENAKKSSDKQNARIEHDKALARVMTAVLKDDTELFKQFVDSESLKRWLDRYRVRVDVRVTGLHASGRALPPADDVLGLREVAHQVLAFVS